MDITSLKAGMSGTKSQIVGGDDLSIQLEEMEFVPGCEISLVSRGSFAGPVYLAMLLSAPLVDRQDTDLC